MNDKNTNFHKDPWNKIENALVDKNGEKVGFCKMPPKDAAEKMNEMFGKIRLADGSEIGAGDVMLHAYKKELKDIESKNKEGCPICDAREPQRREVLSMLRVLLDKDPSIPDLVAGLRHITQFAEKL